MRVAAILALVLGLLASAPQPLAAQDTQTSPKDFTGSWDSSFGELILNRDGVLIRGSYGSGGVATLVGSVAGRRLAFRYTELETRGEGWFELAPDGESFRGKWRPDGEGDWAEWIGTRAKPKPRAQFSGLFETHYGRVRLDQRGDEVEGIYRYSGTWGRIKGKVVKGRMSFEWREPSANGTGEFQLDALGIQLSGSWRSEGQPEQPWTGQRVEPRPGVRWLVILEAYWEEQLEQEEYSFGAMLRAYFRRYPRVELRHRRFSGRADFVRAGREIAFLAEPVVLLIASHGEEGQLVAGEERIPPEVVANVLRDLPNLTLLHFSACEVFVGKVPAQLRAALPSGRKLPISGYAVAVDWAGSALLEQLYLDLILGRGHSPQEAAALVKKELTCAGDSSYSGSPLGALRFRFAE